jgi:hypothetical protein
MRAFQPYTASALCSLGFGLQLLPCNFAFLCMPLLLSGGCHSLTRVIRWLVTELCTTLYHFCTILYFSRHIKHVL